LNSGQDWRAQAPTVMQKPRLFAKLPDYVATPDGMASDAEGNPDSDGLHGELDQPGEPIIWQGPLVVSCFDLVTGPQMVNTAHETPATLSELEPR
jgi:hypothetical protein